MKTDADRIRWAVRFSQTNVIPLGEPALARLRRKLEAFLDGQQVREAGSSSLAAARAALERHLERPSKARGRQSYAEDAKGFAVHVTVTRPPHPWDYSARELHELRRSAGELLRGAAVGDGTAGL